MFFFTFAFHIEAGVDMGCVLHGQSVSFLLDEADVGHVEVMGSVTEIQEPNVYEQLYIEAIFQTHRILTKFLQLTCRDKNPLVVQHITLRRLLRTLLCSTSIPFHGEPAHGLQVMGVLETRCLDFSHMLMLSVEEGMLPKNTQGNTMIPADIREAFGLTTPRHRIAVFSYYFYRLIQRTEHLTCVYNENCVGNSKHEMSRFLRQMLAETEIPIRTLWLRSDTSIQDAQTLSVPKTPKILQRMLERYDINTSGKNAIPLSPSVINTYMTCPLKFFLAHVSGLRADVDPQDGLNAPLIGDIFHDTAELIYKSSVIACEAEDATFCVLQELKEMQMSIFDLGDKNE